MPEQSLWHRPSQQMLHHNVFHYPPHHPGELADISDPNQWLAMCEAGEIERVMQQAILQCPGSNLHGSDISTHLFHRTEPHSGVISIDVSTTMGVLSARQAPEADPIEFTPDSGLR